MSWKVLTLEMRFFFMYCRSEVRRNSLPTRKSNGLGGAVHMSR